MVVTLYSLVNSTDNMHKGQVHALQCYTVGNLRSHYVLIIYLIILFGSRVVNNKPKQLIENDKVAIV